ncbi:Uncharacterised protein [Mycobacteroides abscessus subsp. abscessus]|uniref:DUF4326 domain-containing protein n=1 Tax=Mycobacteroides abscessus TaxID=36809 RepID=UPI000927DC1D|nr:DUF4326 domain-containing protein [Mycobacteroides abscessus]SHU68534.1 Uncharacterised protein [Mycobacteroides abscessus subsp. abscessus]
MPERIQRKRTKGWKMPEGAIYVGRPTFWGNPFRPDLRDGQWMVIDENGVDYPILQNSKRAALSKAVSLYHRELTQWSEKHGRLTELRGHDLVCWCTPDSPRHADVLLKLANLDMQAA